MNKISIIIPAYNEEKNILKTINYLLNLGFGNYEIIVVDGSNNDLTKLIIQDFKNIKYLKNENSSRASSMNIGAKKSSGDLLVFLHADSFLPKESVNILSNIDLNKFNGGGFYKKFTPDSLLLNILSFFNNIISLNIFNKILGDNSFFISKKIFIKIGGFKNIKLMEDVEISKSLRNEGKSKIKIIKNYSLTSSRKFMKKGVIFTILFMQYIRILYYLGIDNAELEERYRKF